MLWKTETINSKRIYVNLFRENSFFGHRYFDVGKLRQHEQELKKSNEASVTARLMATKLDDWQNNSDTVLRHINRAICFAEIDSEEIGVAYGQRATYFHKLKEYSLCLADIELAMQHKYPVASVSRLETMRNECAKHLARGKAPQTDTPALSFPANEKIPCFAQGLTVKHTKKFGKHVVATQDMDIGQTIIVEEAYAIAPTDEQIYMQCTNCFERKVNLMPCTDCAAVMFCSTKCRDMANEKFHAFECGRRDVCVIREAAARLVLRTVLEAIKLFPNIYKLMKIIQNLNDGKPNNDVNYTDPAIRAYMRFFWQKNSVDDTSPLDDNRFVEFAQSIHSTIATSAAYKTMFGGLEESRFLGHLILHHMYVVDANAFPAVNMLRRTFTIELGMVRTNNLSGFAYAEAFYLNSCHLKHSCQPNMTRIFVVTKVVGKVLRPIKSGDQLFVSYLPPLDLLDSTDDRQLALSSKFYFECKCKSCVLNIPPFKESGYIRLDADIQRLLSVFQQTPGHSLSEKCLNVNRNELLKYEKSIVKYLKSNDELHPTGETIVMQFLLMQAWSYLGR